MSDTQTQECKNNKNVDDEEAELLKGQAMVYNHLFAYAETLTLRSAVELRIADIIHSHGGPMSLSQIASKIDAPSSPHVGWLERVMRLLVRKQIFTLDHNQSSPSKLYDDDDDDDDDDNNNNDDDDDNNNNDDDDEVLYGLTTTSKWLLHDQEQSLAPVFLTLCDHSLMKPWFEISRSIKDGESAFVKVHGETIFDKLSNDVEFRNMFNGGMSTLSKPMIDVVINGYKEGFNELEGTIIDVGGGNGKLMKAIVEAYPHIKGINFDKPNVVENALECPSVTHVGGDMFEEVPSADNIIMKSVLHNWTDESCIKALANCQKALLNKEKGRVIIVDIVLNPFGKGMFDDATAALDLMMMINNSAGKDRSKNDWKKLLKNAGFTRINFIPLQTIMSFSVIEAFV